MENLLTPILETLIIVVAIIAIIYVAVPKLKEIFGKDAFEKLHEIALEVVESVEALKGDLTKEEKRNLAIEKAKILVELRNLNIPDKAVEIAIDAAIWLVDNFLVAPSQES